MVEPVHPNADVVHALQNLHEALSHLNMADAPYAIGVLGVDEPYGMVERATERVLTHAFPDLSAKAIMHARLESGEEFPYVVRLLRQEAEHERHEAERAAACDERWRNGECTESGCCR